MRAPLPTRRALLRWGGCVGVLSFARHANAADAVDAAGASFTTPPEIQTQFPESKPGGTTRMRFFGLSVYDARLWVRPGFSADAYATHALALELRYLRSLRGTAIAERSLQEMRRGGPISAAVEASWLQAMGAAFPDVKEGDRLTGLYTPGTGTRFFFNGTLRATIADPAFGPRFLGIWLAPWTSEPRLREELFAELPP